MAYLIIYNLRSYCEGYRLIYSFTRTSKFNNYKPGRLACLYISLYNCYFVCLPLLYVNRLYNHYCCASRTCIQLFFIRKILVMRQNISILFFRGLGRSQSILHNIKTLFVYWRIDLAIIIDKYIIKITSMVLLSKIIFDKLSKWDL